MKRTILKVKNLTKTFTSGKFSFRRVKKEKITAVDDISFQISEGEIVGLLGPNGAGKTTTIQMILGLITPTSGSISVFGLDLEKYRKRILREVNFSSTYTHLPLKLTVWENLYVHALLYGIDNPKAKLIEIMKTFSLTGKKDKQVYELSSGWTTRLNMAKAFLNQPRFILFDEPTASLDPESAEGVRQEIRSVRRKFQTTILFTSHNMAEVEEICDRVVFLDKGKIIARDTPEGLAKRIKISRIEMMIDDGLKRLQRLVRENFWQIKVSGRFTRVEIAEKEIPKFLNLLSERGISYREISIEKPTLEDFFLITASARGRK